MNLYDELLGVIDRLNAAGIAYALCGGLAVALHGYARFTKDIDLLVKAEDVASISKQVQPIGFDLPTGPIPFDAGTEKERVVYRITKVEENEILSLDLLVVSNILQQVWNSREWFDWNGRKLAVISADGLAEMKRLAGRDQDRLDLKKLGYAQG